jgi:undecaprenyl-diphosphatase
VVRARLLGTSFPSGHVLTFVGFYGFLAYLVSRRVDPIALRAALVASLVALIALVGPSRVHQGHHWASDVAGSYLFGAAYLLALIELHRQLEARGILAPERTRLPRP